MLDEFQQICQLESGAARGGLEGAVRHAAIAHTDGGGAHPASLEFLSPIRLPTSTGNRAKEVLEQEDLIRRDDDGRWVLVDPVMASYLRTL